MTSTHQHHSRYAPPPAQNDFRLPSLKDLNFTYQPPNGEVPAAQQEHPPPARHASGWSRSAPNPPPPSAQPAAPTPHQQHTPPLSAGHEIAPKVEYPSKHENGGYAHPGIPLSAQAASMQGSMNIAPRSEDAPHSPNQAKRSRTVSANMNPPRDVRASHPGYPPPQYASYPPSQPQVASPYHQIPSGLPGQPAPPPPHEQMHHHPVPPGYAYQHPYMQPRPPVMHPQHPAHQSQPNHSNPYPSPGPPPSAPPPQGPWGQTHPQPQPPPPQPPQQHVQHPSHLQPYHQQPQAPVPTNPHPVPQHHQQPPTPQYSQQQQPQQFQQQQHMPFARTTAIVPTNIDTRPTYPVGEPERVPSVRNDTMTEITNHCSVLYSFASRYAQVQNSMPHVQPSPSELEEMSQRAMTVVRLLEELRRMNMPEGEQPRVAPDAMQESPDDPRPPKRPWEDISQDEGAQMPDPSAFPDQQYTAAVDNNDAKPQTTAEQDMELIRTKRATSTAGANGSAGQPKSKYRKRSRATPPGKCHSCNIRETPEWRRGPDGARTLCNACGLHYAKLMRKRDKAGANGESPQIDLETLRASARAADIADKASRSSKQPRSQNQQSEPASPMDTTGKQSAQPQQQQHHTGSFQLVNMMAPAPPDPSQSQLSVSTMGRVDVTVNGAGAGRGPPPPGQQQAQQQQQQQHPGMVPPPVTALGPPPPPWPTSASAGRVYAPQEHVQHQSFMRGQQQPR